MTLATYYAERDAFRWQLPPHCNIGTAILERHSSNQIAIYDVDDDLTVHSYTFGDLKDLANRLSNLMHHLGVGRGDRVGIFCSQSVELVVAHLATYRIGAIAVPLFTLFGDDALTYRLNDASVRVLIADGLYWPRLSTLRSRWSTVEHIILTSAVESETSEVTSWSRLYEAQNTLIPEETGKDDPAMIIYTSGTTGTPKGALHGHRVLWGHLPGVVMPHQHFPQPRDLLWTPADWAWIGGLLDVLLPSLYFGVPVVAFRARKFEPDVIIDLMRRLPIRNVFFPPTALRMLRNFLDHAVPEISLRTLASGGESLGQDLWEWIHSTFSVTPAEFYGQTEANLLIGNAPDVFEPQRGSMGLPVYGHEISVRHQDGSLVLPGQVGEICVDASDPVAFLGYWNRPEATADKTRNGFIHTGDLARQDEQGFFYFVGRSDDLINSSGYRIGPTEIEQVLLSHPAVSMAAVIGKPDTVRGEIVKAFIVLRHPQETDVAELTLILQELVRTHLGAYEYPREIEYVDELPTTTTGKIQRNILRQRDAKNT